MDKLEEYSKLLRDIDYFQNFEADGCFLMDWLVAMQRGEEFVLPQLSNNIQRNKITPFNISKDFAKNHNIKMQRGLTFKTSPNKIQEKSQFNQSRIFELRYSSLHKNSGVSQPYSAYAYIVPSDNNTTKTTTYIAHMLTGPDKGKSIDGVEFQSMYGGQDGHLSFEGYTSDVVRLFEDEKLKQFPFENFRRQITLEVEGDSKTHLIPYSITLKEAFSKSAYPFFQRLYLKNLAFIGESAANFEHYQKIFFEFEEKKAKFESELSQRFQDIIAGSEQSFE